MTPKKDKYLSVLLVVLICLIIVAAIEIAKMPKGQVVRYYDAGPKYEESIIRLGIRASKFGGMAIYMDSPAVLLNKADKLALTDDQKQHLQAIIDKARSEATSVLTEDQLEKVSPIPTEPVVLDKLEKTYQTCEQCELPAGSFSGGQPADHEH
jgi:hypothetical protein